MQLTGGEVLVRQLELEGVRQIFGIPGVQLDFAIDALRRSQTINFKTTRNEQSTSYMADGYARASGRPGVCMVVPGPGVLNALAGLSTAFACNSRVLWRRSFADAPKPVRFNRQQKNTSPLWLRLIANAWTTCSPATHRLNECVNVGDQPLAGGARNIPSVQPYNPAFECVGARAAGCITLARVDECSQLIEILTHITGA